jgi:hypothetical protein
MPLASIACQRRELFRHTRLRRTTLRQRWFRCTRRTHTTRCQQSCLKSKILLLFLRLSRIYDAENYIVRSILLRAMVRRALFARLTLIKDVLMLSRGCYFFAAFVSVAGVAFSQSPETSHLPELVIVGDVNSAPAAWFRSDAKLLKLATSSQIHFHVLRPDSKLYQDRYAQTISGNPPLLLFQKPGGGVMFAASAYNMPPNPTALYNALKVAWESASAATPYRNQAPDTYSDPNMDCPDGNCPAPQETPRLRPWNRDQTPEPLSPTYEGWFSDTMSTGILMISVVVVIGLVLVFGLMVLGLVYFLSKFR